MKIKNLYILTLFLLFMHLFYINSSARMVRTNNPDNLPTTLHGLGTFLYNRIHSDNPEIRIPERFTKKDVMDKTGWHYQTVHHKIKLLTDIGVLKVEEGRPNYYQLKSPFDERENLELLAGIKELHRADYRAERRESVVPIIREKIASLWEAKESLDIRLSSKLEEQSPEFRTKFLIAIAYPGLIDLFKSFSSIGIKRGANFNLDYNGLHNTLTLELDENQINNALSNKVWDLFLENFRSPNSKVRKDLSFSIIGEDLEFEMFIDRLVEDSGIEVSTEFYKTFPAKLFLAIGAGSPGFVYSADLFSEEPFKFSPTNEILPHNPRDYGLTLLESFLAHRNRDNINSLYNDFISEERDLLSDLITSIKQLSNLEQIVLIFRYFKNYHLKDTEKALQEMGITDTEGKRLTRERIRQIELKAVNKLSHPRRRENIESGLNTIEDIFRQVFNILYPED